MKTPDVSLVIPVFNEVENIEALYGSIKSAMGETEHAWEAVFVDDGSTDGTYKTLQELHSQGESIDVVRLRRNFGQTAAIAAGLDHARGEIIVMLDGDLQNDPSDIPMLIQRLKSGYDLVSGWRVDRRDSFIRCLFSRVANWLISIITGVHLHDYGCTLKALRRDVAKELKLYGEMHRFIPALAAGTGANILEIPVRHHPRTHGRSKYGLGRTIRVLLDLMTVKFLSGYFTRPGHVFGSCGIIGVLIGTSITAFLGVERLLGKTGLADRPLFLVGIFLIIIGTQFISLGLFGEMLSRVYHEGRDKPVYSVRDVLTSRSPENNAVIELSSTRASLSHNRS